MRTPGKTEEGNERSHRDNLNGVSRLPEKGTMRRGRQKTRTARSESRVESATGGGVGGGGVASEHSGAKKWIPSDLVTVKRNLCDSPISFVPYCNSFTIIVMSSCRMNQVTIFPILLLKGQSPCAVPVQVSQEIASHLYYAGPYVQTGPLIRTLTQILVSHFHDFATQHQFSSKNNGFMLSSSSRHSIQNIVTIDYDLSKKN